MMEMEMEMGNHLREEEEGQRETNQTAAGKAGKVWESHRNG
jgi:hypothetical protein